MKIFGIGVDIVDNSRFIKLIKKRNLLIEYVVLKKLEILKTKQTKFRLYLKDSPQKKPLQKL